MALILALYLLSSTFPTQGAIQFPIWNSKHTLYFLASIFSLLKSYLQVLNGYKLRIKSIRERMVFILVKGPKYSEPSLITLRVKNTLGKGSFLMHIHG